MIKSPSELQIQHGYKYTLSSQNTLDSQDSSSFLTQAKSEPQIQHGYKCSLSSQNTLESQDSSPFLTQANLRWFFCVPAVYV